MNEFLLEFSEANRIRNFQSFKKAENSWDPEDWLVCMLGEIGEAIDARKKIKIEEEASPALPEKVQRDMRDEYASEIADVWTYLDLYLHYTAKRGIRKRVEFEPNLMPFFRDEVNRKGDFRIWKFVMEMAGKLDNDFWQKRFLTCILHVLVALCEHQDINFEEALKKKFNVVSNRVGSEVFL